MPSYRLVRPHSFLPFHETCLPTHRNTVFSTIARCATAS